MLVRIDDADATVFCLNSFVYTLIMPRVYTALA